MLLSQCHTNRAGDTLSQRSGGNLNALCVTVFGMSRCQSMELTESLQILDRQAVSVQMQQAVQQHAAVSCGKNKTVSVLPLRILGVAFQFILPQGVRSRSRAQRKSGMSAVGLLNCFSRKNTDRIDRLLTFRRLVSDLAKL